MNEARVIKIHPLKRFKDNEGKYFRRIDFKLSNGSFAKTDICPSYSNYPRWKNLINRGGGTIYDFFMKDETTIDADSNFKVRKWPDIPLSEELEKIALGV
jgi:hypothetical protein